MIDAFVRFVALFKNKIIGVVTAIACYVIYVKYLKPLNFTNPLPGAEITSNYNDDRGKTLHNGVDLAGKIGTEVLAAEAGTATTHNDKKSGNNVRITHKNGYYSSYSHLKEFKIKDGETVKRGQVIGTVGITGATTGPHLHFVMKKDGKTINPLTKIA